MQMRPSFIINSTYAPLSPLRPRVILHFFYPIESFATWGVITGDAPTIVHVSCASRVFERIQGRSELVVKKKEEWRNFGIESKRRMRRAVILLRTKLRFWEMIHRWIRTIGEEWRGYRKNKPRGSDPFCVEINVGEILLPKIYFWDWERAIGRNYSKSKLGM